MAMNELSGLEQGRAEFAYKCASEGSDSDSEKDYRSYVRRLPSQIKTNGLGSAIAFVKAKGTDKPAYNLIYSQIKDWLASDPKKLIDLKDEDDLVQKVISLDSNEYRAVTAEVLSFLSWLSRFAEGLIKAREEENESKR